MKLNFEKNTQQAGSFTWHEVKRLEKKKRKQRMEIFEKEDQIEEKRDALIDNLEARMAQKTEKKSLFTIAWEVV